MSEASPGRRRLLLALGLAAGWLVILGLGRAGRDIAIVLGVYAAGVVALVAAAWPDLKARLVPEGTDVLLGVAFGAAIVAASYAIFHVLLLFHPELAPEVARLYLAAAARGPAAAGLLVAAVAEELLFRGLLYDAVEGLGPTRAVLFTSLFYAVAQLGAGSPILGVVALALGIVWGTLRASTGRVVAPLLAHLAFTAVVLVAHPLVRF